MRHGLDLPPPRGGPVDASGLEDGQGQGAGADQEAVGELEEVCAPGGSGGSGGFDLALAARVAAGSQIASQLLVLARHLPT